MGRLPRHDHDGVRRLEVTHLFSTATCKIDGDQYFTIVGLQACVKWLVASRQASRSRDAACATCNSENQADFCEVRTTKSAACKAAQTPPIKERRFYIPPHSVMVDSAARVTLAGIVIALPSAAATNRQRSGTNLTSWCNSGTLLLATVTLRTAALLSTCDRHALCALLPELGAASLCCASLIDCESIPACHGRQRRDRCRVSCCRWSHRNHRFWIPDSTRSISDPNLQTVES